VPVVAGPVYHPGGGHGGYADCQYIIKDSEHYLLLFSRHADYKINIHYAAAP